MATLTAKLTLTSTDWHSDSLSLAPSQTLTISGDEQAVGRFTTSAVATKLPVGTFDSTLKKAWIYLKNMSSTSAEVIRVYEDNGGATGAKFLALGAGEWAFFPYTDNDFIWVDTASGTPVLEYGIFEV
jgi:hypothetical protein